MKANITKEQSVIQQAKKLDFAETLNLIPKILLTKIQLIQKEINDINRIVEHYENMKDKFNTQNFNIQNMLKEYVSSITTQMELVYLEDKKTERQTKNVELPIVNVLNEVDMKELLASEEESLVPMPQEEKKVPVKINQPQRLKPLPKEPEEEALMKDEPGKRIDLNAIEKMGLVGEPMGLSREDENFIRMFGGD